MNNFVTDYKGLLQKADHHEKYDERYKINFADLLEVVFKLQTKIEKLELIIESLNSEHKHD